MESFFTKIENKDAFCKFIHECIDDLIGRRKIELKTYKGEIESSNEHFQKAVTIIQDLYSKTALSKTQKYELKVPNLKNEYQSCLQECYDIRKDEIEQCLFKKELSKCNQLFVENIDWKLKWIMGSSTLSTLNKPILQMQLHCLKRQSDITQPCIYFEMEVQQVEKLITALEKVQKKLIELK
ncbi:uncharacterized protein LOC112904042 [Agrilus planipennis]|uniref:Uncharacterized protein LOC112904042 n=1 Tax=Agrilus planipennis TaxID=224129 RepID=A0A7F5QV96_AGRPL|nr:uncharacterized protein LOC112904042 [Agrilus planipennis]